MALSEPPHWELQSRKSQFSSKGTWRCSAAKFQQSPKCAGSNKGESDAVSHFLRNYARWAGSHHNPAPHLVKGQRCIKLFLLGETFIKMSAVSPMEITGSLGWSITTALKSIMGKNFYLSLLWMIFYEQQLIKNLKIWRVFQFYSLWNGGHICRGTWERKSITPQASGACQTHITKYNFSNFRIKSYRESKPPTA